MSRLVIYSPVLTHTVETLAVLWREAELGPVTLLLDESAAPFCAEHEHALYRIQARGDVECSLWTSSPPPVSARMLLAVLRRGAQKLPAKLSAWSRLANKTWLLSELETRNPKYWLQDWKQAGSLRAAADGVVAMAPTSLVRPWFWKRTVSYPNYVHPQLLAHDEIGAAFRSLFADHTPRVNPRPVSMNYIGAALPEARLRALQGIRETLEAEGIPLSHQVRDDLPAGAAVFHSYDSPETRALTPPLHPVEYLKLLRNSEFTLCPNGYDNYSHRVVEAAACGSIPILPAPAHRYAGLKDGLNCIEVREGNWNQAVKTALSLSVNQRESVRRELDILRRDLLSPSRFGHHVWDRILGNSSNP